MPFKDTKIVEFNQRQKSDKAPFIIYGDLECIIQKTDGCKTTPKNLSTNKSKQTYSREQAMKIIIFFKKNEVINKRAAGII